MNKFLFALLLSIVSLIAFPAHAQEEAEEETLAAIPAILKEAKLVNKAKPNLKAKIYFVYQSRSTCGICVSEAPTLVKEYKKMKRKGCEMVMLNIDATPEKAAEWAKRSKMEFPVISPAVSMSCGMPWEYEGRPLLPCMVAMMEGAACEAIAEALAEDQTTVGTALNIEHISATPVGLEVRAEAEVTAVEGKVITFEVKAFDEAGEIGKGTHKRVIVPVQKFLEKAYGKL